MKNFFSSITFGLLCLLVLFALPSCENRPQKKFRHRPHLNLNLQQEPMTMDPRKGADVTSCTIHLIIFEGLTRLTPKGEYEPALAEKIDISLDKKTYTFHIRNTSWSDGSPITAHDVADTWKDMLSPSFPCPNAHLLYPILNAERIKKGHMGIDELGIEVPDPRTLIVHLEDPIPYFLEIVSFCVLSPVQQRVVKQNSSWAENVTDKFPCNGPFRPVNWARGRELLLEKNPYYWDQQNVKLPGISFSFVSDEMTALHMYEMDEIDLIGMPFTPIPTDSLPKFINKKELHTLSCPASTILTFNTGTYPFNNLNIRRAFTLAINRKEIIDNITLLSDESGVSLLPPSLRKGYTQSILNDNDVLNAELFLKRGLSELNTTRDELASSITLSYSSAITHSRIAQTLQNQWQQVLGISVNLEKLEQKTFIKKLIHHDYQIGQCVWYAQYQDPMNILERFRLPENPKNYPAYYNAKYSRLLEDARKEPDQCIRNAHLNKALSILAEEVPVTALYHWNACFLKKPYVKGLQVQPTGSFFLNEVEIDVMKREYPNSNKMPMFGRNSENLNIESG